MLNPLPENSWTRIFRLWRRGWERCRSSLDFFYFSCGGNAPFFFSFYFNWLYVCTEYSITVRVDSDYYAAGVPPTCSVRRSNGPSFTAVRQEQVMNSPQAEFFSFLSDAQQYMFTFYLILFSTQYNFKFAIQSQKIHLFTTNHRSFLHTNYAALPIVF